MKKLLFISLLLLPGLQFLQTAEAQEQVVAAMENQFVRLATLVQPFVVTVEAQGARGASETDLRRYRDLFRFFGIPFQPENPPQEMHVATGSGFIIDKEGHILTNNHVVQSAQALTVKLSDKREFKATVIGRDPDSDVAVIKIEPDIDLAVAILGDSDQLRVGQYAIACGSASGFQGSFSFGHVSALGRSQLPLPGLRFEDFIQTDAAINPGNSGGPLCNIHGQVIGINIAIVAGANSIGFAIPINTARRVIPQLISQGRVVRGFLGVGVTDAGPYAAAVGLPDTSGAFVKTVQPGSPAEKAGLKAYDVIRSINGTAVPDASALLRTISDLQPGSRVRLEIWRNRQPMTVDVTLGEFQSETEPTHRPAGARTDIGVENLSPELAARLRLPQGTTGVVVISVDPMSPWANAGLSEGDVITEIAQQPVRDTRDFSRLMEKYGMPGSTVLIGYYSKGTFDIAAVNFGQQAPQHRQRSRSQQPVPPAPQPPPGQ